MRKNIALVFCFGLLAMISRGQASVVGGITATVLASHFYNASSGGGYLTFGFNATTGAGTGTPDPLTIQKSNLSIGINNNNPQAKLHIKGAGTGTGSTVLVNNSANLEVFRILDNGNVGIGIALPQTTLAVAGVISSKKVKVTQIGWPDFVFRPSYRLPELKEVERYIGAHGHLPGIAPAEEVEKNGLDLGDNQSAMLQKIEELTLYVIRQQKEIEELKAVNRHLSALQAQVEELKKVMTEKK